VTRHFPHVVAPALMGALLFCSHAYADSVVHDRRSGGATTVSGISRDAFAKPAANLPTAKLRDFTFGNKMFNTNWVTAPASVTTLDGLGPTFNRVSCSSCHFKDGRGRPPQSPDDTMDSMLIRLSIPGKAEDGGPLPHPAYGGQLNDRAVPGVPAEGRASVRYEELHGEYGDGTPYTLLKPVYRFHAMAFGALDENTLFSPRVAPAVFGLGLLQAVPEETLRGWEDPQDSDGDGISGRINHVPGPDGALTAGRFGWKANVATLRQQDAGAAQGDMGVTTSMNPEENCPAPQEACRAAPHGGEPEMSDKQLDKMTFYVHTLAVPARRDISDPVVMKGAVLFEEAGCISCHKPVVKTGDYEIGEVAHQEIQPFTDLLLHDMGDKLADGRPDYEATGNEWRTPPLWGIGLVQVVNKHTRFLHDGRARNLEEAILWHGGEGEKAKEHFRTLPKPDREALITFLNSL